MQEKEEKTPDRSNPSIRYVQRACDYIAEHFAEDLRIDDIASHLGLCRSQLYRIFKQRIGVSPQQYLTEYRIRQACALFSAEHRSVKETAFAVGFSDPLYFSSVFKKWMGVPPAEYGK